jgi:DNA (cytosine-5)-methyltransferase 1
VVEICAGAGGQALGLERAGFEHALAVELDTAACATLRANRPAWKVAEGDVADPALWRPSDYRGVALLAGGVPCPPFTVAGRQLGATDERDLFAWAVELCGIIRPRALLLENVRGLSTSRFRAYRQHVLDRLRDLGYVPGWRLLNACDYGVPQLRPRTVLVALQRADAPWFRWPAPSPRPPATVGETLGDLMAARGWRGAAAWGRRADRIAPTIVGGSKKHGGADLGPTRAKRAWAQLGVDGIGIADAAPGPDADPALTPRLTCEMVIRLQGWRDEWGWTFSGRKTARYRQIGNVFPPPVAEAVGTAIRRALEHAGPPEPTCEMDPEMDTATAHVHDPVFRVLRAREDFLTARQIAALLPPGARLSRAAVLEHLRHLSGDFELETAPEMDSDGDGPAYRLGSFRAFLGQQDHARHRRFAASRATVSLRPPCPDRDAPTAGTRARSRLAVTLHVADEGPPAGRGEAQGRQGGILAVTHPDITGIEPRDFDAVSICRAIGAFLPGNVIGRNSTHLRALHIQSTGGFKRPSEILLAPCLEARHEHLPRFLII